MTGIKKEWTRLINMMKTHGYDSLDYILYQMRKIFLVLEDVYSVGSIIELQEAIDLIGTGAGTIFIEAGTHIVDTTIDIDNCGSIVIYGHGDNTVLEAVDGVNIFHITCCASLLIKTIALDISAYTLPATDVQAVLIDEVNDNIVSLEDVTIHGIGGGNFGIGVEINSNNCVIDNCVITQVKSGIFVNGADRTLITNNTSATNAEYGLVLNLAGVTTITGNAFIANGTHGIYNYDSDYSLIGNNGCNDNLSNGIHLELCEHCTVSANAVAGNLLNGIHLTQASYCTLSGNNCNNNDSNTVNPQAGIFITTNSDYNTISANSANNNNNATYPVGIGYGILIAAATCNENIVAANNANGNDIDFQDSGTDTIIEYFVQDEFELQDAINSIGSKSGIINIEASFTIAATIRINDPAVHGGSYIIRGDGSNTTLTPSGNFSCFNVREARSVIFENFAISAVNLVGTTAAIYILENSDNAIFVDNITIVGDGTNGYGVQISSPNCRIKNCNITSMLNGIIPTDEHCIITGNICNSNNNYGIFLNTADYITVQSNTCRLNQIGIYLTSSNKNLILGNTIEANTADGIFLNSSDQNTFEGNIIDGNITTNVGSDHAGITLTNSLNNFIVGNTIINNTNGGAGEGYGVYLINAACVENIVRSNNLSGNDIKWKDVGVNSDIEYKCSTNADIQDAIDSIDTKTGTIDIVSGNIAITTAIDVNKNGIYNIKGEGNATILDVADGIECFSITNSVYCVISDIYIDITNYSALGIYCIHINETANRKVVIKDITIVGDGTNGYGAFSESDYCIYDSCNISNCYIGLYNDGDHVKFINNIIDNIGEAGLGNVNNGNYALITGNTVSNCGNVAIIVDSSIFAIISNNSLFTLSNYAILINGSDYTIIVGNNISDVTMNIAANNGAIHMSSTPDYCLIASNLIYNITNTAGGWDGIGIKQSGADTHIIGNLFRNCDINITGAGYRLFGDDTVYGAGWNGDLGTATKNAIYDKIQLVIAGAAGDAFKTITGITNDVVADGVADTLTFVVGAGLTIVGTAATDTITFTNTITQYTDVLAVAAVAAADDYLKLVGDTMGGVINMGSNNITGVNTIITLAVDSYDKLRVWNSNLYTIGMRSAMTYGGLNSYAMTFTMNNNAARGFVWRDFDDAQNDGAMSLTTTGILTVKGASTFQSSLQVDGNITTGGTVDGINIAARDHAKYTDANARTAISNIIGSDGKMDAALDFDGNGMYNVGYVNFKPNTRAYILCQSSFTTNDYYHGYVTGITTQGGSFGIPMYSDTTANRVSVCVDTSINTMPCIGIWLSASAILTEGTIRHDAWNFTIGKPVYVNGSVLSTTIPPDVGDIVQVVGVSITADSMFFRPSLDWVVR